MNDKEQTMSNSLTLIENISLWKKMLRKIVSFFSRKEDIIGLEEEHQEPLNIIIPEAVQMPEKIEDKNSTEYLYKLSYEKLDELNSDYDKQMEAAKIEIARLEGVLNDYKDMIKKLQNGVNKEI